MRFFSRPGAVAFAWRLTIVVAGIAPQTRAQDRDAPTVVVLVEPSANLDPAQVRGAVSRELGAKVLAEPAQDAAATSLLTVQRNGDGHLVLRFVDQRGNWTERIIPHSMTGDESLATIAAIAGNLARDQISGLLPTARPASQASAAPQVTASPLPAAPAPPPSALPAPEAPRRSFANASPQIDLGAPGWLRTGMHVAGTFPAGFGYGVWETTETNSIRDLDLRLSPRKHSLRSLVGGGLTIGADAMVALGRSKRVHIGLGGSYGFLIPSDCSIDADCSARQLELTVGVRTHLYRSRGLRLWLNAGFGFECLWAQESGPHNGKLRLSGPVYGKYELGSEVLNVGRIGIGPFLGLSIADYDTTKGEGSYATTTPNHDFLGLGFEELHYWFSIGFRGVYGL